MRKVWIPLVAVIVGLALGAGGVVAYGKLTAVPQADGFGLPVSCERDTGGRCWQAGTEVQRPEPYEGVCANAGRPTEARWLIASSEPDSALAYTYICAEWGE